jgi:hypothetical protein
MSPKVQILILFLCYKVKEEVILVGKYEKKKKDITWKNVRILSKWVWKKYGVIY